MPISKSAKKALRVQERKTAINRYRKARVKEALRGATAENTAEAVSLIDKAAKWGIIHVNKAARLKSRLAKKFTESAEQPTAKKKPAKRVAKARK